MRRMAICVGVVLTCCSLVYATPQVLEIIPQGHPLVWEADLGEPLHIEGQLDLSEYRSIRMELESARASLENIEIAFLSPDLANCYYTSRMRVNWRGTEPLQMDKRWFSTRGSPQGWERITGVEFRLTRALSGGTEITIHRLAAHPEQALIKYGDHEVIIDPFYNFNWRDESAWRIVRPAKPEKGKVGMPTGYYDNNFWYEANPGKRDEVVFQRDFDIDISKYGEVRCKLSATKNAHSSVWALVDGVWMPGEEQYVKGTGNYQELAIPLNGERLQGFRLDLSEPENAGKSGQVACILRWIMLREKGASDWQPRYYPAKKVEMHRAPLQTLEEAGLPLGVIFTREEIPKVRTLAQSEWGKPLWEDLKKRADAALELNPEDWVASNIYYGFGVSIKGVHSQFLETLMDPAFAYVVTGDTKYADLARRALLALCQVRSWTAPEYSYPIGFRYTGFNICASQHTQAAVFAYDCIANTLTEEEKALVKQTVLEQGYAALYNHVVNWGDYSNRGASMARSILFAGALLGHDAPGYDRVRRRATNKLLNISERYYGQSGVTREGLGYGGVTMYALTTGIPMAAKLDKTTVPQLVFGSGMHKYFDYYAWMRGNTTEHWGNLNYGVDHYGGAGMRSACELFFVRFFKDRKAQWVYDSINRAYSPRDIPREVYELAWSDPDLQGEKPDLGLSKRFVGDGFTFWKTGWEYGDILFALNSGPHVRAGYERNAFVLEAYGDRLALDPGWFGSYNDPAAAACGDTHRHNCPTFDRKNQIANSGATVTDFITGDVIEFQAADATAAYEGATKVQRRIAYLRPDLFVLVDDLASEKPVVMMTHINGVGVPEVQGNRFFCRGPNAVLEGWVLSPSQFGFDTTQYPYDNDKTIGHQLTLKTAQPATAATFVVLLHPVPLDQEGQMTVQQLPTTGGVAASVSAGERQAVVLCGPGGSSVASAGYSTDAQMAAVQWQNDELQALGMLRGTRLDTPGYDLGSADGKPFSVTLNFAEPGQTVARVVGGLGKTVSLPLLGKNIVSATADGKWKPLTGTTAGGNKLVKLPKPATEYGEVVLSAGLDKTGQAAVMRYLALPPRMQAGDHTCSTEPSVGPDATPAPRLRGMGEVLGVAFSPDGKTLLVGGDLGLAWLFDAQTYQLLHTLRGHRDAVTSVAYSPDSRYAATASWDRTVRLWDLSTGEQTKQFDGHTLVVGAVAFSPDGATVASASWDRTVRLWDVQTGEMTKCLLGHAARVHTVAFSPDGTKLASGSSDRSVRLWDAQTGEQLKALWGRRGAVLSVKFSRDGRKILTSGWAGYAALRDVETGEILQKFPAGTYCYAAISPDGAYVLTGTRKGERLKLWNAATGAEVRKFTGTSQRMELDPATGKLRAIVDGHTMPLRAVAFSPDGRRILTGARDCTARLWDTNTGQQLWRFDNL